MKLLTLLSGVLWLSACNMMPTSEGDLNAAKPKELEEVSSLQFSITEADVAASSQVMIEYTNAAGETNQATLALSQNEQGLQSEALDLEPGDYTLTQFLVLNEGQVSFATPQNTSDLMQLVGEKNALPVPFTVAPGKITTLNPMLLSTGEGEGKDFLLSATHKSFSWKSLIVSRVVALAPNGAGTAVPTTATLTINADESRRVYRLLPTTNFILILSPAEQFTFTVTKDGYAPAQQTFSRAQLLNSLKHGQEITVTLAPTASPSVGGRVIDADCGLPVRGVTVQIINDDNAELAKTVTRADGSFHIGNIPAGQNLYVVILKAGHISYGLPVNLAEFEHKSLRFPISRIMPSNQMRIVLTWENRRADFDAYLRIVNASNNAQVDMLYWKDRVFRNNVAQAVFTTGDDRIGLGFESMQLSVQQLGKYKFQFLARQYPKLGHMTPFPLAGLKVTVFRGDSVMGIFDPNMLSQDPNLKQYSVFEIQPELGLIPVNVLQ